MKTEVESLEGNKVKLSVEVDEGEFDQALRSAFADTSGMSLIQVHLAVDDFSHTLERLE